MLIMKNKILKSYWDTFASKVVPSPHFGSNYLFYQQDSQYKTINIKSVNKEQRV